MAARAGHGADKVAAMGAPDLPLGIHCGWLPRGVPGGQDRCSGVCHHIQLVVLHVAPAAVQVGSCEEDGGRAVAQLGLDERYLAVGRGVGDEA
jgi:hypothetical protein